jgi:hypothetical protein
LAIHRNLIAKLAKTRIGLTDSLVENFMERVQDDVLERIKFGLHSLLLDFVLFQFQCFFGFGGFSK